MTLFQDRPMAWRRRRFWTVCVWVRALLLPALAYLLLLAPYGRYVLAAAAGASSVLLVYKTMYGDDNAAAWWSRPFHAGMAALVCAAALACPASGRRLAMIVGALLVADVVAGSYMSTYRADWSRPSARRQSAR